MKKDEIFQVMTFIIAGAEIAQKLAPTPDMVKEIGIFLTNSRVLRKATSKLPEEKMIEQLYALRTLRDETQKRLGITLYTSI